MAQRKQFNVKLTTSHIARLNAMRRGLTQGTFIERLIDEEWARRQVVMVKKIGEIQEGDEET